MTSKKQIQKMLKNGRYKAIIKEVAGRRMLLGFERRSKSSRKYGHKSLTSPIDLDRMNNPDLPPIDLNGQKPAELTTPPTDESKQAAPSV